MLVFIHKITKTIDYFMGIHRKEQRGLFYHNIISERTDGKHYMSLKHNKVDSAAQAHKQTQRK